MLLLSLLSCVPFATIATLITGKYYYRGSPPELLPFWPEGGHNFDIRGSTTRIWSASDNWLQLECIQGCIAHWWARSQPFSTSADASSHEV